MQDTDARCKYELLSQEKKCKTQGGKDFLVPGYCQALVVLQPVPCTAPGQAAPHIPLAGNPQHCFPGGRLETRVLARLLVTSLPPGHSNIYPLQYLTPCLNLKSFQYYLDCNVQVSLGNSSPYNLLYLVWECRASTVSSDKNNTDRAVVTEGYTPGRTVIISSELPSN